MLQFVSRAAGKPTIAAVADSLLRNAAHGTSGNVEEMEEFGISILDLQAILEGNENNLSRMT